MKKKILFLFLLGIFSSSNYEVNAGILGNRGRYIVQSNGRLCCGYTWFSNQCARDAGGGNVYRCEPHTALY